MEQCTASSGMVQDCPLFTILSEDEQRKCKMPTPPMIASEKLAGVIGDALPGGVAIQYGPGPAIGNPAPSLAIAAAAPSEAASADAPSVDAPAPTSAEEFTGLPGGVFQEAPTSTAEVNAQAEPSPEPTPTPTPTPSDPPVPAGYELLRTDYVTNGNVVSKIVVIETVEYVMLATETVTVTATFGAEKARRELHHLHRHNHRSH